MDWTCNTCGRGEKCMQISVRKTERRPLGGLLHRWQDNIEMSLEETEGKLWIGSTCCRTLISGGLL
jgi:hypothetical protein